jgi:uncharacterized Zn ribbon protein
MKIPSLQQKGEGEEEKESHYFRSGDSVVLIKDLKVKARVW